MTKYKCPICGKPITDSFVAYNLRDHLNQVHKRKCTNRMVDLALAGLKDKPGETVNETYTRIERHKKRAGK